MIAKPSRAAGRRALPKGVPLEVRLSLRFRFGEDPEDQITMLDQQSVPLVGSALVQRDRALRAFLKLMVLGGLRSPAVMRELVPVLRLGARRR